MFNVPEKILETNYTISIADNLIYIYTEDEKNALTLSIPEVSGQLVKGSNTIRKIDGEILLNQ